MAEIFRAIEASESHDGSPREWLVTNGLGGFASGTVSGKITRRYHGLLIAALAWRLGRMVILSDLAVALENAEGDIVLFDESHFRKFTLAGGMPTWAYEAAGIAVDKSIVIPSHHNIVHVTFKLRAGAERVRLRLRPMVHFRKLEEPVDQPLGNSYSLTARGPLYEISAGPDLPPLRIVVYGGETVSFVADGGASRELFFESEEQRGYAPRGA